MHLRYARAVSTARSDLLMDFQAVKWLSSCLDEAPSSCQRPPAAVETSGNEFNLENVLKCVIFT